MSPLTRKLEGVRYGYGWLQILPSRGPNVSRTVAPSPCDARKGPCWILFHGGMDELLVPLPILKRYDQSKRQGHNRKGPFLSHDTMVRV